MLDISRQHVATMFVGMNPISFEEERPVPEQVTIVNKNHVVRPASGLDQGVNMDDFAETLCRE